VTLRTGYTGNTFGPKGFSIEFLRRVTPPSVFPYEFALLEVITELSTGQHAGIRWAAFGVEF
jgi:hypothetical protein